MGRDATRVMPPKEGEVFNKATAATHQRIQIPDSWRDRFLDVAATGINIMIVWGDSGVQAAADQQSTINSEVITFSDTTAFPVLANTSKTWKCPSAGSGITHFSFIGADTSGRLIIAPSDDPKQTRS